MDPASLLQTVAGQTRLRESASVYKGSPGSASWDVSIQGQGQGSGHVDEHVNAEDFPAWYFAEIEVSGERRVVSIFHVVTPSGAVPYWFDDSENQHRSLPLMKGMKPVSLGDYATVLRTGDNMTMFVALCKAIDDLPDPLDAVQVIHWLGCRGNFTHANQRIAMLQAVSAVRAARERRRREFDKVMSILLGEQMMPFP